MHVCMHVCMYAYAYVRSRTSPIALRVQQRAASQRGGLSGAVRPDGGFTAAGAASGRIFRKGSARKTHRVYNNLSSRVPINPAPRARARARVAFPVNFSHFAAVSCTLHAHRGHFRVSDLMQRHTFVVYLHGVRVECLALRLTCMVSCDRTAISRRV